MTRSERSRVRFETRDGQLYIDGKRVIKAWESWSGWYWFAVEAQEERVKAVPGLYIVDTLYFGLVQGFEEEWGYWRESELRPLIRKGLVWEIRQEDLPFAGRR